jgi:enterochelin esterase-like enzyme
VAVLVDPRGDDGQNHRGRELGGSGRFGRFVAGELLPDLAARHGLEPEREDLAVLGTSLGGVASALCFGAAPERIGAVGLHSPALWVAPDAAREALLESPKAPLRVFLSYGTFGDDAERARELAAQCAAGGLALTTVESPQGHSWGQWRWVMDRTLETLLPPRR